MPGRGDIALTGLVDDRRLAQKDTRASTTPQPIRAESIRISKLETVPQARLSQTAI